MAVVLSDAADRQEMGALILVPCHASNAECWSSERLTGGVEGQSPGGAGRAVPGAKSATLPLPSPLPSASPAMLSCCVIVHQLMLLRKSQSLK